MWLVINCKEVTHNLSAFAADDLSSIGLGTHIDEPAVIGKAFGDALGNKAMIAAAHDLRAGCAIQAVGAGNERSIWPPEHQRFGLPLLGNARDRPEAIAQADGQSFGCRLEHRA